jgi:hypothetical protein
MDADKLSPLKGEALYAARAAERQRIMEERRLFAAKLDEGEAQREAARTAERQRITLSSRLGITGPWDDMPH